MVTIKVADANVIEGKDAPDFNYEIVNNGWNIPAGTLTITLSSNYVTSATTGEQFAITAEVTTAELNDFYFNVVEGKLTVVAGAAMIGGTYYATVAEALAAAQTGETVTLVADTTEAMVMLVKGVTLDLNGKKLTAGYVVAFNGNKIVDNSTNKAGRLICSASSISLAKNNEQMPIWIAEDNGYAFATMKMQSNPLVESEDGKNAELVFRPSFGKMFNPLLATDDNDEQVTIIGRISWIDKDGNTVTRDYACSNTLIDDVYTNGLTFKLAISNMNADVKISILVVSDLGVIVEQSIKE